LSAANAADRGAYPEAWSKARPAAGPSGVALGLLFPLLIVLDSPAARAGHCSLQTLPEIPVTMHGLKPLMHAQINGTDALFVADSGAFFNMVSPAAVQEFQLKADPSYRLAVSGVGGVEQAHVARANTFTIFGVTVPNVAFIVAGGNFGGGAVGLLGQNLFRIGGDVEYDLANGVIRLVRPMDCGRDTPLAYWASAAKMPYSAIDIEFATPQQPHTKSVAYLNGTKIHVMFDTGAGPSLLTLDAAKRAGITPTSEGVTPGGALSGIGHKVSATWIGRFNSFKIGDEEIQHAQLRFGDVPILGTDMLIGADFFLSHRIYVATSQRKLYFTYNGGPVFDLTTTTTTAVPPAAASAEPPPEGSTAGKQLPEPAPASGNARLSDLTDAAGYARRGAASAARHDYDSAIADLTRACELAPTESTYFYERGMAHWGNKQADAALADFDQAIKLKPDDVDALLARATFRTRRQDSSQAIVADLDAADRALPKEADAHLRIGELYVYAGQPAPAVVQYSKWIDARPRDDVRMPAALNARCRARALGLELNQALEDCSAALKMRPNTAAILDSRGLVYLRLGNYDKAIADYDAALHLQPKIAWSLYGRGVARLGKGMKAESQADIDAALALDPGIAQRAHEFGIGP
jgi:tetratricopeptide (TPR) repeat protein